jgi:hypothetical protein
MPGIFAQPAIATVLSSCPFMTSTIGYFEHPYWLTWEKYNIANKHVTMKDHINMNNIANEENCDFMERLMSFQTILMKYAVNALSKDLGTLRKIICFKQWNLLSST